VRVKMPTYEHLMLRTGQVIVEEWYDKLVKALNAMANESSVTYDGVIKRSLSPEVDLLMNLGEAGKRLLSGFFGYGYFTYEIRVGSTIRVLPDKIIFPDLSVQTRSADNIVAEHEAKVTGIHGVGSSYICKTSRSDQLPSWDDIPDKPSSFPPSAHADTHKDGGTDEVIGIAKMGTTLPTAGVAGRFFIKTDTLELYYDDGTNWIKIGKLAGLDLDAHASRHNYGGADPITDLDASQITSGVLSADRIPKILPDKLDAIDTPSDGEVPSYNAAQGKFEWVPAGAAEAGLDPELEGYIWYHWMGDAIDGFGKNLIGSGEINITEDGVTLSTGPNPGDGAELYRYKIGENMFLTKATWDKQRLLRVNADVDIGEETYAYFGTGGVEQFGGGVNHFIEFEFGEGSCNGRVGNGVGVTSIHLFDYPSDYDITHSHVYEIKWFPGTKIEFYVDGNLEGTITDPTNFPSGDGNDSQYLFVATIYSALTDTNLPYSLDIHEVLLVQYP